MDVEVVIETPQGSRNKYKVDPKSGRIRLDRMLFTSTVYPLDYGEIPGTLAEDGDPVDILVWLDEPTFPGCLVSVRPVAVFWMTDERGPDAKLLGVAAHDVRKSKIRDLADVPRHLLNEIGHFFDIYKELEPGKATDVRGWMDRAEAERVVKEARVAKEKGPRSGVTASGPVPGQRADMPGADRHARVLSERNVKLPRGNAVQADCGNRTSSMKFGIRSRHGVPPDGHS
jgi:inorganic pyrophosphatase